MKQDNNRARVDRAWEQLLPVLEKEFPQKEKERRVGLWLLAFIAACTILYLGLRVYHKESVQLAHATEEVQEVQTPNKEATIAQNPQSQSKESTAQNAIDQSNNEQPEVQSTTSSLGSESFPLETQSVSTKDLAQDNYRTTIINKVNQAKEWTNKEITTSVGRVENTSVKNTNNSLNSSDKSSVTTSISKVSELQSALPLIYSSYRLLPLHQRDISTTASSYSQSFSDVQIAKSKEFSKQIFAELSAETLHQSDLTPSGLSMEFAVGKRYKHWALGLDAGVGYNDFFRNHSAVLGAQADININPDEDQADANGGGLGGFNPNENVIEDNRTTTDQNSYNRFFFQTGLFLRREISEQFTLEYKAGIEKYFLSNDELDLASQQRTGMTNRNEFVTVIPYNELSIGYNISDHFTIQLGYRFGFRDLVLLDKDLSTNKFQTRITYIL